jgi:hypothetical protein
MIINIKTGRRDGGPVFITLRRLLGYRVDLVVPYLRAIVPWPVQLIANVCMT